MSDQPYDSRADTLAHIRRVNELLLDCCIELQSRAVHHDQSKLEDPEKAGFDVITIKLKGMTYGSDEYRAALRELKPTLEHHYAHNSHHPEHYPKGIDDMSLFDVIEMLMDWKAATERMQNGGDIMRSLEINAERFKMSPQLVSIFRNTIEEMMWVPLGNREAS